MSVTYPSWRSSRLAYVNKKYVSVCMYICMYVRHLAVLLLLYCIETISVAPIIGSVIGKTIYWLCFLYTTMMKKATDTDTYMYILEILAHVHQTMFTNTSSCISCTTMLLLLLQCTVSCCSNTAAINNINWSFTIKFLVTITTK